MKAWKRRYATKKVPCDFCGDKHIFGLKTAAKEWSPENQDETGRIRPFHRNISDPDYMGPSEDYPDDPWYLRKTSPVPWDSKIKKNIGTETTYGGEFLAEDMPREVPEKTMKSLREGLCPHCGLKFEDDEQVAARLPDMPHDPGNLTTFLPRHFRCFKDVVNACPVMRDENYDGSNKQNGVSMDHFTVGTHVEVKPKVHEAIKRYATELDKIDDYRSKPTLTQNARDWIVSQEPKTGSWGKRYRLASEVCDCGDQLNVAL